MRIRCQDCGREYIVSARQVAQAYRLGGYTCERCEGEMQAAAARSGEYPTFLKVKRGESHACT